jgi:hypothetical protein
MDRCDLTHFCFFTFSKLMIKFIFSKKATKIEEIFTVDLTLGAFTNYVYKIWGFFDYLPPSVYIFYGMKVYKKSIFLTTYPPTLVNVVCERPPI